MKKLRSLLGIVALSSLCVLFTACPGGDDGDDPKPNPPIPGDNPNPNPPIPGDNVRGPISYTIDGKSFETVLVDGGSMGDFYMMQTEILPGKHSFIIGGIDYPIDKNYDNVIVKIEMHTLLSNLRKDTGLPWRLPTREEWKYAAKGGKKSSGYSYCGSNSIDNVAWYSGNSSNKPHEVATKSPNELGLYDMSGNYAELCFNDTETNPVEGYDDFEREVNVDGDYYGGCWNDPASECTPSSFKNGSIKGKVAGSSINEKNAVNGNYVTIRLVYSR